ncbi:periplasmic heavy metal sensor [Kiloniella majae]|uniref:periplasmic heavy metal sensor n=1 Tax=Kiloniella majae TaxID=1938558 RepID=UPI000A278A34|nr:periplasmic heavy metal sensor [Kiloniella majae]
MPVPSKKVLTILFSISLALNIFMGGLIGSHMWHARTYGPDVPHSKPHEQRKQWRELSSEQRDLFKKIWRENKDEIKSTFKELRASHKRLKANLKGKTERTDFEAAFEIFRAEQSNIHSETIEKLLDIAMTLPPKDRSTFLSLWGTRGRNQHGKP